MWLIVEDHGCSEGRANIDILYGTYEGSSEIGALVGAPAVARARGLILGLSLSRRVIELHKGQVAVGTQPDGRAICRVVFPTAPPGPPPPRPSEQP